MALNPLITPQGPDFIKNWPFQNKVNCDNIDAFVGLQSVQAYTPIFTAEFGGLALGTGTLTGWYFSIFNTVYSWGEFRFGTGMAAGSGFYEITLPFLPAPNYVANLNTGKGSLIGTCRIWQNSTISNRQSGTVQLRASNKVMFNLRVNSGARSVSNTFPFAWTTLDGISWSVTYLKANS